MPVVVCISVIVKVISLSCFALPRSWARRSLSGPVSIGSPATADIRLPKRWPMRRLKAFIRSKFMTRTERPAIAKLELRYRRVKVLPPIGKQKRYPPLDLTVILVRERGRSKNCARIERKLITNLPVRSRGDVVEKLSGYAMRRKIEVFHKILKSGCCAEEAKLQTAERLVKVIAFFCIMSSRRDDHADTIGAECASRSCTDVT